MMNIKILAFLTPPSIYHGCSTRKTVWEENFTGEEQLFSYMNTKNGGRRNVMKHIDIKDSKKYVTLEISLKFDNLDKMKITSSESKGKLERLPLWVARPKQGHTNKKSKVYHCKC